MSDKARNAIAARTAAASFHFSSQQRVCLSAVPTVCRRRRDRPYSTVGGGLPGSPGGDKRGRDTKVSLPLLTPQPFLRTRLPSVARLKARGPQGRLLLQGYTLDGSGAFRSDGVCALHCLAAHCYARRITQADLRALQRPTICPTHGTELS